MSPSAVVRPLALAALALCAAHGASAQPARREETYSRPAWDAYAAGDRQRAVHLADSLLRAMPRAGRRIERMDLSMVAGRALTDLGRPAEARPYLERVLALRPDEPWVRAWAVGYLAKVRFALGDDAGARAAIAEARTLHPTPTLERMLALDWKLFGFDSVAYAGWTTRDTPHLRLHFSPRLPPFDRDAFAAARERVALSVAATLGDSGATRLPKPIDVFVWDSDAEAEKVGVSAVRTARPALGLTHLTWDQSVGHEIAHVVVFHAVPPEVATGFVAEGIAVWFDGALTDRFADAVGALGARGRTGVDVRALWRDWGALPLPVAYPVAGAVMDLLVQRGGMDRMRALLRTQGLDDARRIYGPEFDGWLDDFERRAAARLAEPSRPRGIDAPGPR